MRPAHPCHVESLRAVPPQPIVLVRSQFAQAQDELLSNLNSYPELEGSRFMQIVDGTVCRYQRAGFCVRRFAFRNDTDRCDCERSDEISSRGRCRPSH